MFGKVVAKIVHGLTKISKLSKSSDVSLQAENFKKMVLTLNDDIRVCLLYTSPSPRDRQKSRMPSSA